MAGGGAGCLDKESRGGVLVASCLCSCPRGPPQAVPGSDSMEPGTPSPREVARLPTRSQVSGREEPALAELEVGGTKVTETAVVFLCHWRADGATRGQDPAETLLS